MTVTLNLRPQVEQAYLAEAQARGLELADVMREVLVAAKPVAVSPDMPPEEWIRKFEAWTRSHAERNLPVLSDQAMSRDPSMLTGSLVATLVDTRPVHLNSR